MMRKILATIALFALVLGCYGQSKFKRGIEVDRIAPLDSSAVTIDGVKVVPRIDGISDSLATNLASILLKVNISDTLDMLAPYAKQSAVDLNTAKVTNATHTGDVTGSAELTISPDSVNDTHINFGTGTNQVSAVDIPIADAGSIITATNTESALQENRTAVTSVAADVNTLNTATTGVAGWIIGLNATLDSMVFTLGNAVYKVPIGETVEEDVTAPTVTAIEVGNHASDTVIVTFSEAMDTDSINSAFSLREDGSVYGIGTPIFYSDDTLKIPLDSVAEAEKSYTLTYSRPGASDFIDVAGNKLLSFGLKSVINNIESPSDIYEYLLFENNDNGEMGVMTFTWTGSEAYRTDGSPPQGSYSTSCAAGATMTTNESHDLGVVASFSGWWNGGNDDNAAPRYLFELDGVDIWIDYTDGAQYIEGTIGGQSFQSTLIGDETMEYKWAHVLVTYDGVGNSVNGYARIYLNGVNVSSDSLVGLAADMNGIVSIAWDGTDYPFYGDWDDVHFYKAVLTDADAAWMYTHPGEVVGGRTDPPVPPSDIIILMEEDWDDFSVTTTHTATSPTGITRAALAANLENYESLGSDDAINPDLADNADIVLFDGSNALKSWFLDGQCCTGSASHASVSNGGTGIDLYAYINSDQSTETEVYISYNLYIMSGFVNSEGFKQPGVVISKSWPEPSSRLMILEYDTYSLDLALAYYTHAFWTPPSYETTWGTGSGRTNTKNWEFTTGQWVNITIRAYSGTTRGEDGRVEVFIDGIYYGEAVSSIPFKDSSTGDFLMYEVSTFMGGNTTDYTSTQDQWTIHDEIVIFQFDTSADVVRGGTPSAVGRDISGTLRNISSLNFPR